MERFNHWVDDGFEHDAILTIERGLRKKKEGFAALFWDGTAI
jgi:hypothetical protein